MGIYDRDYLQDQYTIDGYKPGYERPAMPPVVKWLLIINIAVYLVCGLIPPIGEAVYTWGSVFPASWANIAQVWRLISYQFLHSPTDLIHIIFNMMVLFFFGPLLEHRWGSKRFLKFYLAAGAAGGIVYTFLVILGILDARWMIGASGGIYGLLGAITILFPQMRVIFLIFPMTMRTMAILLVFISLLFFLTGKNAGGEAAHLTGMAVGILYVLYQPRLANLRMEKSKGQWSRKIEHERSLTSELDRILEKIHTQGLTSLNDREKEILREATQREQEQLR